MTKLQKWKTDQWLPGVKRYQGEGGAIMKGQHEADNFIERIFLYPDCCRGY